MRAADIVRRLVGQPYQPFRIHLSDGTRINVRQPRMVVGVSSAVLPTAFARDEDGYQMARDWRTIALSHISQFSNLVGESNGKGRKRK